MAEYLIQDTTLTGIADAIRTKTGDAAQIPTPEMKPQILSLWGKNDTEEVTIGSTENGDKYDLNFASGDLIIGPSAETKVLSQVTIKKPEMLASENIAKDKVVCGIVGAFEGDGSGGDPVLQEKTVTPRDSVIVVTPDAGYDGLSKVTVKAVETGGSATEPYIEYTYNDNGEIVSAAMYGFTEIPDGCFAYSSALTSVDLSGSPGITSIGEQAFRGCSSLTNFDIPDTVTSIGSYAFYQCAALESIDIPDGATSIGNSAFYGCSSLTSVDIPESVITIGVSAFRGCTSLKNITLPNGLTSISDQMFYECKALTSIAIPNTVTRIGDYAFYGCAFTSITVPNSVTSIGNRSFMQCKFTNITIPANVTNISAYAFMYCSDLTSATFEDTTTWYVGASAGATTTAVTVTNASTAATYLKTTHVAKYWTKV